MIATIFHIVLFWVCISLVMGLKFGKNLHPVEMTEYQLYNPLQMFFAWLIMPFLIIILFVGSIYILFFKPKPIVKVKMLLLEFTQILTNNFKF